jgi:hypothetical protein
MDRAVLDAYGWSDLKPTCEFILEYEEEEFEDGSPRKRKKPWRYRWADDYRDEVLGRLLVLNHERVQQENIEGVSKSEKVRLAKGRKLQRSRSSSEALFE